MNFNSKRSVTDEQNERHKRMLAAILKEEGNKSCADCKTRNPTWASVNLGVFVCLTCSGIHRSLGVHISQVRSCNLDTWLPKQVEFCRIMGNVKGNKYWEARLPKDFRRPPSGNPNPELAAFIRAKYVDRAYAATDVAQPPTIDNYLDHPYAKEDESTSSAASSASAAAPAGGASSLLRGTPNKASASSPALTMDLLGGFDELASGPSSSSATAAAAQQQAAAAAANSDPFSAFGTFVSAPPPSSSGTGTAAGAGGGGSLNAQRNSLEWTDFHSATDFASAPSTTALHPQVLPPPPAAAGSASGHHRSYSISEGVPTAPSSIGSSAATGHQPSRFSAAAAAGGNLLGSTMPAPSTSSAHHHHGHHHGHHGHAAATTPQPAAAPAPMASPSQPRHQPSGSDPFASLGAPDDLLAGLTIHHVMESFASPSAASSTGGAPPAPAATSTTTTPPAASGAGSTIDDLFTFSSSATPGDLPPPGAGHRRKPSQAKAGQEEVLRLFDAVPSTSSASGGAAVAAAVASSADPFGDFLSAAPAVPAVNGHTASNGLGLGGVPNLL
ncbi:hypothetical protein HYH02_013123 [Chlamydomonas schloesseri]|uniref:Arf-GAP domain-containing protein n=1 Tax=Chlamydomonas schloesseri TaxID=2026947 RepID=A0A835SRZ3_9CHLO|nr:hypothetical protein HYH02_013123 [Chlamydomonas schloesseri]|eukprot:KAG2432053.1 hypothetical protein HYH02_013123 [Chlamydomonas schloesseri]